MQHRYSFSGTNMPSIRILLFGLACLLLGCSAEQTASVNSGASPSGVTMREVVGDFCPPAQATKGNC
jgi:hypothetical protein